MKRNSLIFVLFLGLLPALIPALAPAARARIPKKVKDPYLGAIVINAADGEVIFNKNADTACYPASMIKLMVLLVIQEKIEQGALYLSDRIRVTAPAARTGGSQVYLKEGEVFTLEDLLYSLIIQSANDSAVALAIHIAGSPESFAKLMQQKARELGMKNTEFHSVHGLPPSRGHKPDISTPRDLARLARELLKHPDILKYTSTRVRKFRDGKFIMRTHNHLLGSFTGCDGLKTGYIRAGGFSIVATAKRRGVRFIAVVVGSPPGKNGKKTRDRKTRELLARAFSSTPLPPPTPLYTPPPSPPPSPSPSPPPKKFLSSAKTPRILYLLLFLAQAGFFFWLGKKVH